MAPEAIREPRAWTGAPISTVRRRCRLLPAHWRHVFVEAQSCGRESAATICTRRPAAIAARGAPDPRRARAPRPRVPGEGSKEAPADRARARAAPRGVSLVPCRGLQRRRTAWWMEHRAPSWCPERPSHEASPPRSDHRRAVRPRAFELGAIRALAKRDLGPRSTCP
jgi:hypothetical protein